jgi:hypothetical protein
MHLDESPESFKILGTPETRQVFGGDELRLYADHDAVETVYDSLLEMEAIARLRGAAR